MRGKPGGYNSTQQSLALATAQEEERVGKAREEWGGSARSSLLVWPPFLVGRKWTCGHGSVCMHGGVLLVFGTTK